LNNRLINFKATKTTLPLYYPAPAEVEDLLADGKVLKFNSLPDLMGESSARSEEQQARKLQSRPKEDVALEALRRSEILAKLSGEELNDRLTEMFRAARTSLEEGGSNTLFLALGMLQWVESRDVERKLLAPLIMIPVTLERKGIMSGFTLRRHDDDTVVNPTLLQLLEQQFEVCVDGITGATDLPMDD